MNKRKGTRVALNSNMLVSVLVPVYNTEAYLDECLSSIVTQTYPHLEIVIYNDGSTDSSMDIVREWQKKDARIRIVEGGVNKGLGAARNGLMAAARGEYFTFVDADDWIDPPYVATLVEAIGDERADLVQGLYGLKTVWASDTATNRVRMAIDYTTAWYKLIKTEFVRANQISCVANGVVGEDVGLSPQLYLLAAKITFVSLNSYHYRQNVAGSLVTKLDKLRIGRTINMTYVLNFVLSKGLILEESAAVLLIKRLIKYMSSFRHISVGHSPDAWTAYQAGMRAIYGMGRYLSILNKIRYRGILSVMAKCPGKGKFILLKLLAW